VPRAVTSEPAADPFGERGALPFAARARLLGADFHFRCESAALLNVVRAAYAALPSVRLARHAPRFTVSLTLLPAQGEARGAPPLVAARAASGLVCGSVGGSGWVAVAPERCAAVIAVRRALLRFPYHVRYELLEFAVYVLAARAQRLVPLHAACVARRGAGVLLIGESGAGKSTIALHSLLGGLDFLAEDSVLVEPADLRATGVANFLHVRPDSLRFLRDPGEAARIRRAPRIRRRSGVEKLEIDLRRAGHRLTRRAPRLCAVVFVSPRAADGGSLLRPLGAADLVRRLSASQPYAAGQAGWKTFLTRARRLPAYELRRGSHPGDAVDALRLLLRSPKRR